MSKIQSEMLIDDGNFVQKNKLNYMAIFIFFCLSVIFFSLYITKTTSKGSTVKKGS